MRRTANLTLLISGFALGQGALFLSQTVLVQNAQLTFLGQYGIVFSFLILALHVVDWGGTMTLARESAKKADHLEALFWGLVSFRLFVATGLSVILICSTLFLTNPFYLWYVIASLPGIACYSLNIGGLLDGHGRSGLNGIASAAPYISTASGLSLAADMTIPNAPLTLGILFSCGALIQVACQYAFYGNARNSLISSRRLGLKNIRQNARDGAYYIGSWGPNQLLFRSQLLVVSLYFGPASTGTLLYVKQVVNATMQLGMFIRRIEFPYLAVLVTPKTSFRSIFRTQLMSYGAAVLSGLALITFGQAIAWFQLEALQGAQILFIIYALLPITSALYGNMNQIAHATGKSRLAMWVAIFYFGTSVPCYLMSANAQSLTLIAFAEVFLNGIGGLAMMFLIRRVKPAPNPATGSG